MTRKRPTKSARKRPSRKSVQDNAKKKKGKSLLNLPEGVREWYPEAKK